MLGATPARIMATGCQKARQLLDHITIGGTGDILSNEAAATTLCVALKPRGISAEVSRKPFSILLDGANRMNPMLQH